jgi:hypothetical protein
MLLSKSPEGSGLSRAMAVWDRIKGCLQRPQAISTFNMEVSLEALEAGEAGVVAEVGSFEAEGADLLLPLLLATGLST